jgi:hypothetical protein
MRRPPTVLERVRKPTFLERFRLLWRTLVFMGVGVWDAETRPSMGSGV